MVGDTQKLTRGNHRKASLELLEGLAAVNILHFRESGLASDDAVGVGSVREGTSKSTRAAKSMAKIRI